MSRNPDLATADYARFAEASAMLALAAVLIPLLPFKLLVRTLAWGGADPAKHERPQPLAARLTLAVERASRRMPWRTVCFHRGLATHWMLRRRGLESILHYGVGHGEGRLGAHVWVSLDGHILIGADEAASHACVASFPAAGD